MTASEHVLIFGSGGDAGQRYRALRPDLETTLMCRAEHLHRVIEPAGHRRVIAIREDAADQEWVRLARAVHADHPITRVSTFGEFDQDRAAVVAEALGLACYPPDLVRRVFHKHLMRERLAEAGVEKVPAAVVDGVDGARHFAATHGLPLVLKPVAGTASFGVSVVHTEADLAAAYARAADRHEGLTPLGVLVEPFIPGPQFSVESFSAEGDHVVVAITRKYSDATGLVELGHVLPVRLPEPEHRAVTDHVSRTLDALGVEFGPTHTEIVLSADGPRTIETHLRVGGDDLYAMVHEVLGLDLVELQFRQVLGEAVLPRIRAGLGAAAPVPRAAAIWFASSPAVGELVEVTGVELPADLRDHVTLKLLAEPGRQLTGLASSYSRLAQARATGADESEALERARRAIEQLTFTTRVASTVPDLI